jgi:uncharacterized protein YndB with AHSA1/START domain
MSAEPQFITVETRVNAPVEKVWKNWTTPEDIVQWNAASDDWCCPSATNDLRVGGTLTSRMEARDGSMGFDFSGTYTEVTPHELLAFRMGEGEEAREVRVEFQGEGDSTVVKETFAAENTYPIEAQRAGWQSILDRFKAHVEAQA